MKYNYEALDPESFQKLAQALIVAQFPNAQSLPVGQPDGGKDALFYVNGPAKKKFVVFQVKFSRHPAAKDDRDVIVSVIKSEADKVRKLIAAGATQYVLITNVSGTAHPETGSIDRAQKQLAKEFKISTQVWWRDDLDARLDNSTDVKWSYPQICPATDVLSFLVTKGGKERELERINRIISAYIARQYSVDSEVKFKQVELKKSLTDLFVDLPIGLKEASWKQFRRQFPYLNALEQNVELIFESALEQDGDENISFRRQERFAAQFFVNLAATSKTMRFVLEGAPGQGKSTVTQYICQVNRLKLLRRDVLEKLPLGHQQAPARVPFRVDLRDLATWMSGRHPYTNAADGALPSRRSLENFLAMQVGWQSGAGELTQNDLLEFLEQSHSLIVLDGFDEIADRELRQLVVEEISQAADRLEAQVPSAVLIVTSRPAAFANSPGFSEQDWLHMELKELNRETIEAYKNKWLLHQGLDDDEKQMVSQTLAQKLEQPHLRDLARNPMQLAILLHLIHIQGAALPDKRTALYDKYMELFFNREAEKSSVVRDYRDLLLAIHGYLGWVLQCQAEQGLSAGSVDKVELQHLVKRYLESEGHDTSLADMLLMGIEERVVAIVSRVQGKYEFEVQPIREFFAARYLYQTAPYSPPGSVRTGTRPERFEALAKNFYWTNVARFFCGFYDRGELGSLIDSLAQISEAEPYRLLNHPRRLGVMLLNDWVLAQSPRDVKRMIEWVTDEPAFTRLLTQADDARQAGEISVPQRSGQSELREACCEKLRKQRDTNIRRSLRRVTASNWNVRELKRNFLENNKGEKAASALYREAMDYGLLRHFDEEEISAICAGDVQTQVNWLAHAGRVAAIIESEQLYTVALEGVLNEMTFIFPRREGTQISNLEILSHALRPTNFRSLNKTQIQLDHTIVVPGLLSAAFRKERKAIEDGKKGKSYRVAEKLVKMIAEVVGGQYDWTKSQEPWKILVDAGLGISPTPQVFVRIAMLSAAVASRGEKGGWSESGWEASPGLSARLRYARLKVNDSNWWARQLDAPLPISQRRTLLVSLMAWAGRMVIDALKERLSIELTNLSNEDWQIFNYEFDLINGAYAAGRSNGWTRLNFDGLTPRLSSIAFAREKDDALLKAACRQVFRSCEKLDGRTISRIARVEFFTLPEDVDWGHALRISQRAKQLGIPVPQLSRSGRKGEIPESVARDVLENSDQHSAPFIAACEASYHVFAGNVAPKVSAVAEVEKWFPSI